jgi:hypothetical protein
MPIQLGFWEWEIELCSIFCKEIPTRATVHCPKQSLVDEIDLLFTCDSIFPFPFGIRFRENLVDGSKHTLELKLYGRNGL